MPDGQYDYETSPIKGILNAIKSFSKIESEKAKLKGELLTEQLKQRSNFMWKAIEKGLMDPIQREFYRRMMSQRGAGMPDLEAEITPETYIPPEARTRYEPTYTGAIVAKTAPIANALYQRITQRERAGMPLSEGEQDLKARIEAKMGLGPKVEEEKEPFTAGAIQKTLGELESGGATTMLGEVIRFEDLAEKPREAAINHVLRKLGPDWRTTAPEALEIIDRKWPEEGIGEGEEKYKVGQTIVKDRITYTYKGNGVWEY